MKKLIEQIDALATELRAIKAPSPYVHGILGGLSAARDNAVWETERAAKEKAESEKAKSEKPKDAAPHS